MSLHLTNMPHRFDSLDDYVLSQADVRRRPPPVTELERGRMRVAGARLFATFGPGVALTRIRIEARVRNTSLGSYATKEDLLADLLVEHLVAVSMAVAHAEDKAVGLPPEALLERLILAWMDAAGAAPDAHRAFLLCAHVLPEQVRRSLDLRRRIAIEQMQAALAAAVPAFADHLEAPLALYPLIRLLLSDPHAWPAPVDPSDRPAAARRLAGMLIAAAEAEALGHWPRLGLVEGPERGAKPAALSYNRARARLREVMDAAEAGCDTLLTRRGRVVARVVRAEGQTPPKPKRVKRKT